jgi:hypothetical protein
MGSEKSQRAPSYECHVCRPLRWHRRLPLQGCTRTKLVATAHDSDRAAIVMAKESSARGRKPAKLAARFWGRLLCDQGNPASSKEVYSTVEHSHGES